MKIDLRGLRLILKSILALLVLGFCLSATADKISYTAKGHGYYRVLDESGNAIGGGNITEREALEKAAQLSMDNRKAYFVIHDYRVEVLFERAPRTDSGAPLETNLAFSWEPPTQRADGSALPPDQIKEYLIYGGETDQNLKPVSGFSNINSVKSQVFFMPAELSFFALSAVDQQGLESELSNIAEIQI